jgi:hypothetical protein
MKTKKLGTILLSAILLAFSIQGFSQEEETEMNKAMFHISFITPLGTNGIESWNTINHFSINLFAGFSGGLEGLEIAGFANGLKGDMTGIQIAGFCNNTFGYADGLEIAGFYNYNHKDIQGVQIAGFANGTLGDVIGAQVSGFANHSQGSSLIQFAGFSNTSMGNKNGLQAAGFANFSRGEGVGAQISGFANANTKYLKGIQIAGFANAAKKIKGFQIAPFNVADTIEDGAAIGIWSYVRNGYKAIQIGGNETLMGEISFKSGVKKFYNIIALGANIRDNTIKWGWGYGIGSLWSVSEKFDVGVEVLSYHLNEDRWWSDNTNLLNRLNLTANLQLTNTLSIYAGTAWNVWVTSLRYGHTMNPTFSDWNVFDKSTSRTRVTMYPGLNAGIRVSL